MQDRELLRAYVERHSEPAFAELVARHLGVARGAALRIVGDAHLAQDVAQTVFVTLARRPWTVRDGNALPAWVYRAACREACNAVRAEQRRKQRELEAMKRAELDQAAGTTWDAIAPLLDEAMGQLKPAEQSAVILRFFENKSFEEVGRALELSEDTAQKRVSRAVEKLREYFSRRGVGTTGTFLATALAAHAAPPAPAALAASIAGTSLAGAPKAGVALWVGKVLFSTGTRMAAALLGSGAAAVAVFGAVYVFGRPAPAQATVAPPAWPDKVLLTLNGTLASGVPINLAWSGAGPQFALNTTLRNTVDVILFNGTFAPAAGAYQMDYQFQWKVPIFQQTSAVSANIQYQTVGTSSSALIKLDQPVTVMNSNGSKITLTLIAAKP